jgi:hypothetical protein
MPVRAFTFGSRTFDMWYSLWNGTEVLTVDGREVSRLRSFGVVTPHHFSLDEDGRLARYEFRFGGWLGHVLKRDGAVVVRETSRVKRYLISVGLALMILSPVWGVLALAAIMTSQESWVVAARDLLDDDLGIVLSLIMAVPISIWLRRRLEGAADSSETVPQ